MSAQESYTLFSQGEEILEGNNANWAEAIERESKMVPPFDEIMKRKGIIIPFDSLTKQKTYAVVGWRYIFSKKKNCDLLVVNLWSADEFPLSWDNTQEVWGVAGLKKIVTGANKQTLPVWVGLEEKREKGNNQGGVMQYYHPVTAMAFSAEQLRYYPWAQRCKEGQDCQF